MRGLLADVNVQGHTAYLRHLLVSLDLWGVLAEIQIEFATFADLQISPDLDDRSIWNYCQTERWVLFTENRNDDGLDSLQSTLTDSWQDGCLPVLTLSNKVTFERIPDYARRVAADVAELLFGIALNQYRDQSRIYIPRSPITTT